MRLGSTNKDNKGRILRSHPHPALTLPAVIADTQLLSRQVAVAMVRTATVGFTVRDITSFPFPVLITLTVHLTRHRDTGCTLSMARAVVGTRIDSGKCNSHAQTSFKYSNSSKIKMSCEWLI